MKTSSKGAWLTATAAWLALGSPVAIATPSSTTGPLDCVRPADDGYGDRGDLFVLTEDGRLHRVSQVQPGIPERTVTVTGLQTGERLLGIDTRPANGQLYGVGSTSRLYVLDPASGAASAVGTQFATLLSGTDFGVDFNPVADRLRIVSNTGQNLRVDPTTGAIAAVDATLAYAPGDENDDLKPRVTASGYTDSESGAASTALYGIDTRLDNLVLQGSKPGEMPAVSPNTGLLRTVGSLRLFFDVIGVNGFDILGVRAGGSFDEDDYTALAAVRSTGDTRSQLIRIDLATGRASARGLLPDKARGLAASAGPATKVWATTSGNQLVSFERSSPVVTSAPKAITGLQAGESVVGIDVRPATGKLFALTSASRVYTVDPGTAAATLVGSFSPQPRGFVGLDVNPVVDRLRVVTSTGQNLRLHPDTGALVSQDGSLAYAADDANANFSPNIAQAAYTRPFVGGGSTALFDIDAALDVLARQDPPNDGTLRTIGGLGTDAGGVGGFDIAPDGVALAGLRPAGSPASTLYCVDLASGRAQAVGSIGLGTTVSGLAVAPRGS